MMHKPIKNALVYITKWSLYDDFFSLIHIHRLLINMTPSATWIIEVDIVPNIY